MPGSACMIGSLQWDYLMGVPSSVSYPSERFSVPGINGEGAHYFGTRGVDAQVTVEEWFTSEADQLARVEAVRAMVQNGTYTCYTAGGTAYYFQRVESISEPELMHAYASTDGNTYGVRVTFTLHYMGS